MVFFRRYVYDIVIRVGAHACFASSRPSQGVHASRVVRVRVRGDDRVLFSLHRYLFINVRGRFTAYVLPQRFGQSLYVYVRLIRLIRGFRVTISLSHRL